MTGDWFADELVRRNAHQAGHEPAILSGEVVVTWADLDRRCDVVAARLVAGGVRPGEVVALVAEASADAIATLLGIGRARAVAAPIPTGLTPRESAAAIDVLAPTRVLREIETAVPSGGHPWPPSGEPDGGPVLDERGLEDPAIVVLTSGTTGRPKGVVLSARAMAASAQAWLGALPPATGWLLALGLGHVGGLGVVWRAIAGRVPVRIVSPSDPVAFLAGLGAEPPSSHVSLVPTQLHRILDSAAGTPPPPTLRAVLLGGGSISPSLVLRAVEGGWPIVPTYGLSEAASGVTSLPSAEAAAVPGSAGRPLPGVVIRIDAPGPDGVGEIVVTSPARSSGYRGDPGPASRPEEPIRTGDLGRLDESGRLFVVDRRTDRIVRGGENIAPGEVEAVLLEHPAIADAAVVPRPDPLWGQVPVAAIVLRPAVVDPRDEELAGHCRARLAGFKVPAAFARLDALPRTAGGRLRRGAVRGLFDGSEVGELARPGGDRIGWRTTGRGSLPVVLLHGTLSTSAQLDRLAVELSRTCDATVHAVDRRGGGTGRLGRAAPLDVAVHVRDLVAYLDARGIRAAVLVGVSFGGVLALELAARQHERVLAVVAWEPPYGPLADRQMRAQLASLAEATITAHRTGGPAAAAEVFMRAVAGDAAWERLTDRARASLGREGDGAVADAALQGLEPDGLADISAPVALLTGGASQPFYAPIADALADRIPRARRVDLVGLAHPAPITDPRRFGAAIRDALAEAGLVESPPSVVALIQAPRDPEGRP